jgi:hypothetical protein
MNVFASYGNKKHCHQIQINEPISNLQNKYPNCSLYCNGNKLSGAVPASFENCTIEIVPLIRGGIELFIRSMTGQSTSIEISEEETLESLKQRIRAQGITNAEFNLYASGVCLTERHKTLKDYQLSSGSILMMVVNSQ